MTTSIEYIFQGPFNYQRNVVRLKELLPVGLTSGVIGGLSLTWNHTLPDEESYDLAGHVDDDIRKFTGYIRRHIGSPKLVVTKSLPPLERGLAYDITIEGYRKLGDPLLRAHYRIAGREASLPPTLHLEFVYSMQLAKQGLGVFGEEFEKFIAGFAGFSTRK